MLERQKALPCSCGQCLIYMHSELQFQKAAGDKHILMLSYPVGPQPLLLLLFYFWLLQNMQHSLRWVQSQKAGTLPPIRSQYTVMRRYDSCPASRRATIPAEHGRLMGSSPFLAGDVCAGTILGCEVKLPQNPLIIVAYVKKSN